MEKLIEKLINKQLLIKALDPVERGFDKRIIFFIVRILHSISGFNMGSYFLDCHCFRMEKGIIN